MPGTCGRADVEEVTVPEILSLPPGQTFDDPALERLHRKQRLAAGSACSPGSDSTRAWPDTSPHATRSGPTTSGSTLSACTLATSGSRT